MPEDSIRISINPKIYPVPCVMATVNKFTEEFFVSVEGDPEEELVVHFKPNEGANTQNLEDRFKTMLVVSYSEKGK